MITQLIIGVTTIILEVILLHYKERPPTLPVSLFYMTMSCLFLGLNWTNKQFKDIVLGSWNFSSIVFHFHYVCPDNDPVRLKPVTVFQPICKTKIKAFNTTLFFALLWVPELDFHHPYIYEKKHTKHVLSYKFSSAFCVYICLPMNTLCTRLHSRCIVD